MLLEQIKGSSSPEMLRRLEEPECDTSWRKVQVLNYLQQPRENATRRSRLELPSHVPPLIA